jgi:fructokinase
MLCEGEPLRRAADFANAAGALAVTKRGPMEGNSTKRELEDFIARHKKI